MYSLQFLPPAEVQMMPLKASMEEHLSPKNSPRQSSLKPCLRTVILVLYTCITILEAIRGVIHTFLYTYGLNDVSGLATGDSLCDNRLSALMIGYGGANLESLLLHAVILVAYLNQTSGLEFVVASCVGSALWTPITRLVSSAGNIDVGDAQVPGKDAMLVRSIVSLCILILALVRSCM